MPSRCCPIFAKDILEVGPTGLGFLRTAPAVGAFVAALMLARYPIRRRAGPTLFVVVAGFGVSMVVFGLSREMWLSMLALALGGAFDMVSVVLRSTILPLVTPDELRGRVNAVEMVFISGSNELGAFESGVAAALIGAVPAVVLGGVATIVVAGVWWKLFPVSRAGRPARRAPAGGDLDSRAAVKPGARPRPCGSPPTARFCAPRAPTLRRRISDGVTSTHSSSRMYSSAWSSDSGRGG